MSKEKPTFDKLKNSQFRPGARPHNFSLPYRPSGDTRTAGIASLTRYNRNNRKLYVLSGKRRSLEEREASPTRNSVILWHSESGKRSRFPETETLLYCRELWWGAKDACPQKKMSQTKGLESERHNGPSLYTGTEIFLPYIMPHY